MIKQIKYSKQFKMAYTLRIKKSPLLREEMREAVKVFQHNPLDPSIKIHSLKGKMSGKKAFNISADLRIVYVESKEYYIFLDIGTHGEVYKTSKY